MSQATRIADEIQPSHRIFGGRADRGLVIVCDHASNALPRQYGTLGLAASELERHIAYDIGAAAIAEQLSKMLDAPAVLSTWSRLLIDLNRGEDDPTLIMQLSDGAVVPGNKALPMSERTKRIETYYRPYHEAVSRVVAAARATGQEPAIFSVHSMTHVWKGVKRPWDVAFLSGGDRRLADAMLSGFRADPALCVGDNEPYQGGLDGNTMAQHAHPYALPHVVIEYRQDLVASAKGQQDWANRTAKILASYLSATESKETIMPITDPTLKTELEAAAYRRLVEHLRTRTDVQNIDLMNLAGFCRNCLANWLQDAAKEKGAPLSKDEARETVYGMPYEQWRSKFQTEASAEQKAALAAHSPHKH